MVLTVVAQVAVVVLLAGTAIGVCLGLMVAFLMETSVSGELVFGSVVVCLLPLVLWTKDVQFPGLLLQHLACGSLGEWKAAGVCDSVCTSIVVDNVGPWCAMMFQHRHR